VQADIALRILSTPLCNSGFPAHALSKPGYLFSVRSNPARHSWSFVKISQLAGDADESLSDTSRLFRLAFHFIGYQFLRKKARENTIQDRNLGPLRHRPMMHKCDCSIASSTLVTPSIALHNMYQLAMLDMPLSQRLKRYAFIYQPSPVICGDLLPGPKFFRFGTISLRCCLELTAT